ncbi:hypothetical protein ARMSODRAFT_427298 [Armillaria solidipes]|uniref:Uncharacterized protein n=1 Tax=Armillaria solidipes TaxID=1076256 RepID=A0A2H3CJ62_9AGAR|nr:hypothetical protein ARMSODRAFT_427298 [Armillaria solidipes]
MTKNSNSSDPMELSVACENYCFLLIPPPSPCPTLTTNCSSSSRLVPTRSKSERQRRSHQRSEKPSEPRILISQHPHFRTCFLYPFLACPITKMNRKARRTRRIPILWRGSM